MTRVLERGIAIIDHLEQCEAASLADLAKGTGLSKATLLRLLATLIDRKWVYRRINDGRYALSICIGGLRRDEIGWTEYARRVAPILHDLTERTGLPADLTVVTATGFLEVIESTRQRLDGQVDPVVVGFRPSMVLSSPGRAILMACSPDLRRRHLDVVLKSDTPAERFHVSSGALDRELAKAVRAGYARREAGYWPNSSDFGEEPMDIAVPILKGETPVASVSIVWPAGWHRPEDIADRDLPDLRRASDEASRLAAS
jgi:IclR family mhp operon transcriptional activator